MSAVFGSPLGACEKWQVSTAVVKCYGKGTVHRNSHVPLTDKFWRSRKCNFGLRLCKFPKQDSKEE